MVTAKFPLNLSTEALERRARQHAQAHVNAGRRYFVDLSDVSAERQCVNYLRHQYTDYDSDQTTERHAEANRLIASAYPWLAEECARQSARRSEKDRLAESAAAMAEAERARAREERRALAAASAQARSRLSVGQEVTLTLKGRPYRATVSEIRRTKVTVAYELRDGSPRTRDVHAALLDLGEHPSPAL
ncbi:hypothetical protein ACIP93_33895 [Streptomyces sp. NPDC088745]|uniref:hypothetical protein n=1 Tax=Streptomyces sp. NPDC088745 TaxID=3365884 RepID=UPI00380BA34F